ncbi:MAG: GFA family protein [Rhizobacter sp.]
MHVHGSCHCGRIRYEAEVDPGHTTVCHCTDCQKLTGTAYRVSVPAREGSFRLVAGEPSTYIKVADSGARRALSFCPNCGSPLYAHDADHPTVVGLRVGCIDEREALVPTTQKWCRSALAWTGDLSTMAGREAE